MNHSPSLICSLAQSASLLYHTSGQFIEKNAHNLSIYITFKADSLNSLDENVSEKWIKYLEFKSCFCKAKVNLKINFKNIFY